MKKALALLVLAALLVPLHSYAEEYKYSAGIGLFTKHFNSESANENNRLLAFSYNKWCAAWFKNSYDNETAFVGRVFQTDKLEDGKWYIRANLYTGFAYGYGDKVPNVAGISPFLLPAGSLGYGRYSFELGIIPLPGSSGLVTGMFKIEF